MTTINEKGVLFSMDALLAALIALLTAAAGLLVLFHLVLDQTHSLAGYRVQREGLLLMDALVKNGSTADFPGLAAYSAERRRVTPHLLGESSLPASFRPFSSLQSLTLLYLDGGERLLAEGPARNPPCYVYDRGVLVEGRGKALLRGVFCRD